MSQEPKAKSSSSSGTVKIAGQKWEWPKPLAQENAWSFERRPGGWIIASRTVLGGKPERVRFYYEKEGARFSAKISESPSLDFFGEKQSAVRGSAATSTASDYTAQFPGKVQKLKVSEGAEVQAGQALLMVEAMKMEFAIKAASAGTLVRFLVEEGMTLTPGQKLLEFTPKTAEAKS